MIDENAAEMIVRPGYFEVWARGDPHHDLRLPLTEILIDCSSPRDLGDCAEVSWSAIILAVRVKLIERRKEDRVVWVRCDDSLDEFSIFRKAIYFLFNVGGDVYGVDGKELTTGLKKRRKEKLWVAPITRHFLNMYAMVTDQADQAHMGSDINEAIGERKAATDIPKAFSYRGQVAEGFHGHYITAWK